MNEQHEHNCLGKTLMTLTRKYKFVVSQVLMAKYRDLQDLKKLKPRAIASNTWYKIYRGWELVKSGLNRKLVMGT